MPTGITNVTTELVQMLDHIAPLYQNKHNGFLYVPLEDRNKQHAYLGISNRRINALIKAGYAIRQDDGGIVRTDKQLPSTAANVKIPDDMQQELDRLRVIETKHSVLVNKLFAILEDL